MIPPANKRPCCPTALEDEGATAQELSALAQQHGVDLGLACHSGGFLSNGRFLFLWRKNGSIGYNGQGPIRLLPERFKQSAGAFNGMWAEAGSFEDMEQALAFAKAWLIDGIEVDDLPRRSIRRCGI